MFDPAGLRPWIANWEVVAVGAPLDITAQELRIEALFPADEPTEQFARDHLGGPR